MPALPWEAKHTAERRDEGTNELRCQCRLLKDVFTNEKNCCKIAVKFLIYLYEICK